MRKYIKKHVIAYTLTIVSGIIYSLVNIYISFLIRQFIDSVMAKDMDSLSFIVIKTIAFCITITVCYFLYIQSFWLTVKLVRRDLRHDVFKGVLSQDYNRYYSSNTADYISLITNDINIIEESYIIPSLAGIQQSCLLTGAFLTLLRLNVLITVLLVLCVMLAMLFPSLYNRILQKRQREYSGQLSHFTKAAKEYYSGFEVIKSFNLLDIIFKKFKVENEILANVKLKNDNAFNVNESVSFFFGFFSPLLILLVGGYLILINQITMGILIAMAQLSGSFVNPISRVMQSYSKVSSTRPIIKKLLKYMENSNNSSVEAISFTERLTLKNVAFSYEENGSFQIKEINLSIENGKKYAVIGASGSGKTTLINLIVGREKNHSGDISVDGVSFKDISESTLNQLFAINHQNIFLFDGTVKDNICLFREYDQATLESALLKSGVNKFLPDLHEGIFTYVGENGNKLSGGQKQRIALARAFIQQKPILILDEGTSAVDMQTGFEIENDLLQDSKLTLIAITHRITLDLLSRYDEIIVLENGHIKEMGSYEKLIKEGNSLDFIKYGGHL